MDRREFHDKDDGHDEDGDDGDVEMLMMLMFWGNKGDDDEDNDLHRYLGSLCVGSNPDEEAVVSSWRCCTCNIDRYRYRHHMTFLVK